MPFVSRLKNLGTVFVPELNTTLTVYLLNLEGSEETNLVYKAQSPIASDASPPANLRFTCPDAQTKCGDVLLWGSKLKPKSPCIVRGCWVFDGSVWVKPDWNSQVRMEHPEHSDYELVVLSGPLIKWELKQDPGCGPSLSIPDPPIRLGVLEEVNTSPTAIEELRRTTRQSDSREIRSRRMTTAEHQTPTSSAEQSTSRLDSFGKKSHHDPPSQPNQTTPANVSRKPRVRCTRRDTGILFRQQLREEQNRKLCEEIRDFEKSIYAKRHRPPSPGSSSSKKQKTSSENEEIRREIVPIKLFLQEAEARLENRDKSQLPPPLSCDVPSSSQPEAAKVTEARDSPHMVSMCQTVPGIEKLEIQKAAERHHTAALSVPITRHSDQVTRLNQDLDNQKMRVFELEASLRAAQQDLAAQKTRAEEREDVFRRELDLAAEKLGNKEQAIRLADESEAVKWKVGELQHAVVGGADALEAKLRELESMEADYSKLKDAYTSDIWELSNELSSCNMRLKENQEDAVAKQAVAEHEAGVLRRRTADLTRDIEAAHAEMASMKAMYLDERGKLQKTLCDTKSRLAEDCLKLSEQLAEERGEKERIKHGSEALERETREQGRLLEETQATCLRLTTDSFSERERHAAELSQKQAIHDKNMGSVAQELEGIRTKHATVLLDLAASRQEAQDALAKNAGLRQKLEEEMNERKRIERECEAFELGNREQGRLLEETQATCLLLTENRSSERERHVAELSQNQALHETMMGSVVQELEGIHTKHATTLLELAALRQEVQDGLNNKLELEQKIKDAVAKQKTEKLEMEVLRRRTVDLTRDLETAHAETADMKAMSLEEREKFQETLRATETRLEQDCLKLCEQLAEERGEKERIKKGRETLEREIREQGRLLEEARETCLHLTADSSSERERHAAELSQKQVIYEESVKSVVQESEGMRTKHATTLLDLAALRQEVQDTLVKNADLEQAIRDIKSLLEIRDSEKKALQEQQAEGLESERRKRRDAEKLLEAVRRECQEPFVVPTLLDWFVSAHMEARKLSGDEGLTHENY